MSEKQSSENHVKALEHELRSSPIKVTKEDENKFSELEEGYRAEIEGLLAEKEKCEDRLKKLEAANKDQDNKARESRSKYERQLEEIEEAYQDELKRMVGEKKRLEKLISALEQDVNDLTEELKKRKGTVLRKSGRGDRV